MDNPATLPTLVPPSACATMDPATADPRRWFVEEVQAHEPGLRAYLRGAFPRVRDIDDVVQESYLHVWKARTIQPVRCARAFLFTVARHVALNLTSRERRAPLTAVADVERLPVVDESTEVPEAVQRAETRHLLVKALAALPSRCREITVLRKLHGVPQREVAARLGLSEKTVEEQVARGVRRCEAYLRKHGVTHYLRS